MKKVTCKRKAKDQLEKTRDISEQLKYLNLTNVKGIYQNDTNGLTCFKASPFQFHYFYFPVTIIIISKYLTCNIYYVTQKLQLLPYADSNVIHVLYFRSSFNFPTCLSNYQESEMTKYDIFLENKSEEIILCFKNLSEKDLYTSLDKS